MCKGKKTCRACSMKSKAKVAGRMKKSNSRLIKKGVSTAAGIAAAGVVSRLPFVAANPMLKIVAPVGAAILTSRFLGAKGEDMAGTLLGVGVINAVATYVPTVATSMGVSAIGGPAYKSLHVPGVAGRGSFAQRSTTATPVTISMQ